jgi:rRNA-processing protein FCF1
VALPETTLQTQQPQHHPHCPPAAAVEKVVHTTDQLLKARPAPPPPNPSSIEIPFDMIGVVQRPSSAGGTWARKEQQPPPSDDHGTKPVPAQPQVLSNDDEGKTKKLYIPPHLRAQEGKSQPIPAPSTPAKDPPLSEDDVDLPPGWLRRFSKTKKEYWYYHEVTKTKSWTHPAQLLVEQSPQAVPQQPQQRKPKMIFATSDLEAKTYKELQALAKSTGACKANVKRATMVEALSLFYTETANIAADGLAVLLDGLSLSNTKTHHAQIKEMETGKETESHNDNTHGASVAEDRCENDELESLLSDLSLRAFAQKDNFSKGKFTKKQLVRKAETSQNNWQSFQAGIKDGTKKGAIVTSATAHQPISFKLKLGSTSGTHQKRKPSLESTTTALPLQAPAPSSHGDLAPKTQSRRRKRWLIVDTNTWLDHAFNLTPQLLLQDLQSTEVKIVLPAQVVRELDGLKLGPKPVDCKYKSAMQIQKANTTAAKARHAISFLLAHQTKQDSFLVGWAEETQQPLQMQMKADTRILDCARSCKRVASENDECMLVTEDKNLQLLAGVHNFPAMNFAQCTRDLWERETVWRQVRSSSTWCPFTSRDAMEQAKMRTCK